MSKQLKRIVCGACDLYCGLLAHVDVAKNQFVKITANPDHPLMPNSICRIGMRGMDYVSHPDRLLHPRRRVGERGSGAWEEVSWEEALDDIAARLRRIVEEDGPEAVVDRRRRTDAIRHEPQVHEPARQPELDLAVAHVCGEHGLCEPRHSGVAPDV